MNSKCKNLAQIPRFDSLDSSSARALQAFVDVTVSELEGHEIYVNI